MSEDYPFPSGQHLGAAQTFIGPRLDRLAPGGDFFLVTEDTDFATALRVAAELRGDTDVTGYSLPRAHEATPQSSWLRRPTRELLVFRKRN
jgi:hypothetical protein